jgi:hypothetical protein
MPLWIFLVCELSCIEDFFSPSQITIVGHWLYHMGFDFDFDFILFPVAQVQPIRRSSQIWLFQHMKVEISKNNSTCFSLRYRI